MKYTQIYLFFFISFAALSCTNKKGPDVSHIKLNISIERFDRELDSMNSSNLEARAGELSRQYTWFYEDYMSQMIGVGPVDDSTYLSNLATVLTNDDYLALKSSADRAFPDLNRQEQELTEAFKHIRYYYPKQKIPRIISFISGFAVQTPIGNDYIGIGLDMFLGEHGAKFYPALRRSIPEYIARRFTPENITPRVMEAFIREDMFPEKDEDRSFLSKMIYNGKIMYMMDAAMPALADTLKIGYTGQQMEWCRTNEGGIWAYFLGNELLFESDYMKMQKYLSEAPFTPGLGQGNESAPKLGVWVGWQIVRAYMDRNPDTTLQQLMSETDAQEILDVSNYKPKM